MTDQAAVSLDCEERKEGIAGLEQDENKFIKVKTNDGATFDVPLEVLKQSVVFATAFEQDKDSTEFNTQHVNGPTFAKVLEYMTYYSDKNNKHTEFEKDFRLGETVDHRRYKWAALDLRKYKGFTEFDVKFLEVFRKDENGKTVEIPKTKVKVKDKETGQEREEEVLDYHKIGTENLFDFQFWQDLILAAYYLNIPDLAYLMKYAYAAALSGFKDIEGGLSATEQIRRRMNIKNDMGETEEEIEKNANAILDAEDEEERKEEEAREKQEAEEERLEKEQEEREKAEKEKEKPESKDNDDDA